MSQVSYGERVLEAIIKQMDRRNIVREEFESVVAHLGEEHGTPVLEMNERQLARVQQRLDGSFREYLKDEDDKGPGPKRRGETSGPWPNAESGAAFVAAQAGISISDVRGTGKGGAVTKKDVAKAEKAKKAQAEAEAEAE